MIKNPVGFKFNFSDSKKYFTSRCEFELELKEDFTLSFRTKIARCKVNIFCSKTMELNVKSLRGNSSAL